MTKLVQVGLTSILLLAAFLTISLTWDACTEKSQTKTLEEKSDEVVEKYGTEDDFFEDDYSSEDNDYATDADNNGDFSSTDNTESGIEYSEIGDKTDVLEESSPVRSQTMSGKYLIVAGNFLVEGNAQKMVNKLLNLGYNSAEVSVFDYSQYYTVIASRSDDYAFVRSLSTELKGKGIDNYVHTKK